MVFLHGVHGVFSREPGGGREGIYFVRIYFVFLVVSASVCGKWKWDLE